MIRYNGGMFEGYNGTTWGAFSAGSQNLSIAGNVLSISGGNSVTLPAGGSGGYFDAVNTNDIHNNNAGKVLIGSQINATPNGAGRLLVRDTIAFGTGIRSWTNASYESAIAAHDSAISGNPRAGVGSNGIPFIGQEGLQAYSRYGDGVFAYTINGRGIYLKGGNGSNYAMVIDTNGFDAATNNTGAQGALKLNGPLMLNYGAPGTGKVLTSDANGVASWQSPAGAYTAGSGINIAGGVISATDNSATNELQTISLAGNNLTLSNGGGTVALPSGGGSTQWANVAGGIRNMGSANVAINTIPGSTYALDVRDTIGSLAIANFESVGSGGYITIGNSGAKKGYAGVYAGFDDIDFGTTITNTTGNVNLTIQGIPKMVVTNSGTMIGNGNPQQQLDVAGGIRIGNTTTGMAGSMRYNNNKFEGYTASAWVDLGQATGSNYWTKNNEDISSNNAGKVGIGTSTPLAKLHVQDSSVLFIGPVTLPSAAAALAPPVTGTGNRTMWYAEKAAFRTGGVDYFKPSAWSKDSTGIYSFAAGVNNVAKGELSASFGSDNSSLGKASFTAGSENITGEQWAIATGLQNKALGLASTAIGKMNLASGEASFAVGYQNKTTSLNSIAVGQSNQASGFDGSIAIGNNNLSSGTGTTAIGRFTNSRSYYSTALGVYNDSIPSSASDYWVDTDPLLVVGNGGFANAHNAMTLLKNGKLGINTDSAQQLLDVAGGMRIGNTTDDVAGSLRFNGTDFEGYDGTSWKTFASTGSNNWALNGADISNTNSGKVGIGTNTPLAKLHVADSNVLFMGADYLPSNDEAPPVTGIGNRFMWYSGKAALSVGGIVTRPNAWDKDSIGQYSFSAGVDNQASGSTSIAIGAGNTSEALYSIGLGLSNKIIGNHAITVGAYNIATGNGAITVGEGNQSNGLNANAYGNHNTTNATLSTAIGFGNLNNSYGSTSLGMFSDTLAGASSGSNNPNDVLLTIGNGTDENYRHNAMTMMKNGKTGFNNNAPNAQVDIKFNSNVAEPIVRLQEDGDDYARLTLSNTTSGSGFWTMAGYNSSTGSQNDRLQFYNSVGGDVMVMTGDGNVGVKSNAPNSRLQVDGSFATAISSKTNAYTASIEDHTITADASSASFAITLPDAIGIAGRMYVIKKTDNSPNPVTVEASGSQTIDGSNTKLLAAQWKYMTVQSDGTNWIIIGNN